MPPKRRGGAAKGAGGKKAKKAEDPAPAEEAGPSTAKDAMAKLKESSTKRSKFKPDKYCTLAGAAVVDDYDCMLNQTNIGHNNNKFYVIQVLQRMNQYYAWNRWGRVGEVGANALKGPTTKDAAIKDFEKKFKDKSKNAWSDRNNFKPVAGKYTLIEMGDDEDGDEAETAEKMAKLDEIDGVKKVTKACTLGKETQSLVKLIFDNDMFKEAMKNFDLDVKKMPLGKLSKSQIAKGFEVLEEIEESLKKSKKQTNQLQALTSRFYTLIPHDFGRQRPPIIGDEETLRKKMDMLLVLGDIELAQSLQKEKKPSDDLDEEEVPHPLDANYDLLQCDLDLLSKKDKEYTVLEKYLRQTEGRKLDIMDIWKVNRHTEGDCFSVHEKLGNRKLLWHGTNVAVVTAILKSGLRIMPHSGGRVGSGIYFASENAKSAAYVRPTGHTGIMFLNEVVLGKEHHITKDDWTLKAAPAGYNSIIAKGSREPDPKFDTKIQIEGNDVVVPQGKPIAQPKYNGSYFSQSEYLIYREDQCRIRYLLKLKF